MKPKELAKLLNRREYGSEITKHEEMQAKELGLVVVFGYSDDNMEFRGAISDEVGCYDGGEAFFDAKGELRPGSFDDDIETLDKYELLDAAKARFANHIEAVWDDGGYSWTYKTDIPHATFDVMEDGEKFCRGIVFAMKDLK